MKRTLLILAVVAVATSAVALVGMHGHTQPRTKNSVPVTDMTGREGLVPEHAARILSLCTSATDTLVALGAAEQLDSIDEFSRIVPGAEHATVIGKGSAISREQVVARRIDLAFVWWYQDDAAKLLADAGVPVVRIKSGRAAELPEMIRLIGKCVSRSAKADALAADVAAFLQTPGPASSTAIRPRVFVDLYGTLKTAGAETYTDDLLTLAGAANIAAGTKGSVVFSAETLLAAEPDLILFVGEASECDAIAKRPGFSGLAAVRAGRVVPVDRYWLVAGPHMPESVAQLRARIATSIAR